MNLSTDVEGLLQEIQEQIRNKAFQSALPQSRRAVELAPDHAAAWTLLSEIYLGLGNHQAGYDAADRAIALQPDFAHAYYLRGWARGNQYDYDGEIADAHMAYQLDASNPSLYYRRLARAHANKGETQYALTCCHLILAFDPNDVDVLINRCGLYRLLKQYTAARLDLERVIDLMPGWYVPYYALGLVQLDAHLYKEAVMAFSQAIATDPDRAGCPRRRAFRAHAHRLNGAADLAERDLARARELDPNVQLYGPSRNTL
jgi:tetratricopeptide (TPR) repeat protein